MQALIALRELKATIEKRVRDKLPEDMSVEQFMLLEAIYTNKLPSCENVCEKTGLFGPSVSRMLRDLKSSGLVKSKTCESDKRIQRLSVTTKGGKVYRKHKSRVNKASKIELVDLNQVAAIITNS